MKEFFGKIGAAIKAHKGRTIAISVIAFVLVCVIIALCLLSAFLFNRLSQGYVPTDEQLAAAKGQYKRVVIIGVDGVGDYFNKTYTPNFDKLFDTSANAAVTYTGTAVYPTISCENWMSMFHGVRPVYHGFIFKDTNQRVEAGKHTDSTKYPSFMKQLLDQDANAKIFSSCTWRGVNNGIIEDDPRITKVNSDAEQIIPFLTGDTIWSRVTDTTCQDEAAYKRDEAGNIITEKYAGNKIEEINAYVEAPIEDAKGYLKALIEAEVNLNGYSDETIVMRDAMTMQRVIEANTTYNALTEKYEEKDEYTISYMHLDQVDHAGHNYGYSKPGYIHAVSRVDYLLGWLYDAFTEADMMDDTLFILCTDHGHRLPGGHKNHGKNTTEEVNITFAIAGKTVKQGKFTNRYVNTDMAAIVAYALGVKAADSWQGRVPYGMFTLLG